MSGLPATRWHVYADAAAVAAAAADRILAAAAAAIDARGRFRLVLAGGGTPQAAYRLLARRQQDWTPWHIYYGDERCLPAGHPERNSRMAEDAWLSRVPIPASQQHPIPAELGPEAAALLYAPLVETARPFDLVLLGLGEDGHTAGLFPGHGPGTDWVVPVHDAPKPPADRVSLSAAALSSARELIFLATGAGKRTAVAAWRHGAGLPAAWISAEQGVDVYLDAAAWGE